MRIVLVLWLLSVFLLPAGRAGTTAEHWLDRAADPRLGIREREAAARQLMMLADSSASILLAAMEGRDADSGLRRQVAARILGEIGRRDFEAPLLEAAFGEDHFLAMAARQALERLYSRLSDGELYTLLTKTARERHGIPGGAPPGEEDWLVLSLRLAREQGRFKALVMGGVARKYAERQAWLPEPLTWCVKEALGDPDPELRRNAVALTPRVRDQEIAEKVAVFLYLEPDPALLQAGLRAMAELRPPEFGEAVERHLGHADPRVALEACSALAAMGYPGAMFGGSPSMRSVAGFVSHPSTPVRRRAIEILAASKNPAALEYLERALADRVGANRAVAARAIGELGFPAGAGLVHPLLQDPRPDVRIEAAVALTRLGVVGVASGLMEDMRGDLPALRVAAAEALGRIADPVAVAALAEAATDRDGELRWTAVTALGRIHHPRAEEALRALAEGNDDPLVADALRGIGFGSGQQRADGDGE